VLLWVAAIATVVVHSSSETEHEPPVGTSVAQLRYRCVRESPSRDQMGLVGCACEKGSQLVGMDPPRGVHSSADRNQAGYLEPLRRLNTQLRGGCESEDTLSHAWALEEMLKVSGPQLPALGVVPSIDNLCGTYRDRCKCAQTFSEARILSAKDQAGVKRLQQQQAFAPSEAHGLPQAHELPVHLNVAEPLAMPGLPQ